MFTQLAGIALAMVAGATPVSTDTSGTRMLRVLSADMPPHVDGRLDDAIWRQATCAMVAATTNGGAAVNGNGNGGTARATGDVTGEDAGCATVAGGFVQRSPQPGAPATQRTDVRVALDDASLYVALRMYDPAPDSIVARLGRRDDNVHSDWVYVHVGSYDDGRTAFVFGVNPRGVKRDLLVSEDGRRDAAWNAVWHAATAIDEDGWTAELRIPLSQLRYRRGAASWAFNVERHVARSGEVSYWSPTPPDAAGVVSHYGRLVGVGGAVPSRRVEVQPYIVGSVTRAPGRPGDPFHLPSALFGSAGADVRYGVTSALTLNATVNPDFGQVEADPAEVNLTAYETFFSERRPFFTEGTEVFRTSGPELFYSRRIGRAPQVQLPAGTRFAEPARSSTILGAAKLTGRTAGGWTLGALSAVTAEERVRIVDENGVGGTAVVEPLTAYGVARARREFDRGRSGVGVLATSVQRRIGDDARLRAIPASAHAATLDARYRIDDAHEISGSVSGSLVHGSMDAISRIQRSAAHRFQRADAPHLHFDSARSSLTGHAANVRIARMSGGPWRWQAGGSVIGPGFEVNDLGFNPKSDRAWTYVSGAYERHEAGRYLRDWNISAFVGSSMTYGGERQFSIVDVTGEATLRNQASMMGWAQREIGGLNVDALRGGPAIVAPSLWRGYLMLSSDPRRSTVARATLFAEDEDGTATRRVTSSATLQLRPSPAFETSVGVQLRHGREAWQYVGRRADDGGERYVFGRLDQRSAALTLRTAYALSADLSFQLYARPFSYAGRFSRFMEVDDPRAARFDDRFHAFTADELDYDEAGRTFTANRGGRTPMSFASPDVGLVAMNATAVVRWEYRPGSTLFVVWGSERAAGDDVRFPSVGRDFDALRRAPGTNTLMVKLSYWLGL